MNTPIRMRVVVEGRVQRVFFRDSARTEALRLGLSGWVRNLEDGTVEAVFEGPEEDVQSAVVWMRHGPERALVTLAREYRETPAGLSRFEIRG